jgi:hypothetical protein
LPALTTQYNPLNETVTGSLFFNDTATTETYTLI